ncbi:MAG: Rho termination factor N-terminal domain-containing protein, partial [Geodermatophilaceae bacterium]|nr:Rho termination factor N-terminal domain-containing protein [Geodermatophilaceae bacterium]
MTETTDLATPEATGPRRSEAGDHRFDASSNGAATAPTSTRAVSSPNSAKSSEAEAKPRRRASGLTGMLLPELQQLAGQLGIAGTAKLRKGDLLTAIKAAQSGSSDGAASRSARGQDSAVDGADQRIRTDGGAAATEASPASATSPNGEVSAPVQATAPNTASTGGRRVRAESGERSGNSANNDRGNRTEGDRTEGERVATDRDEASTDGRRGNRGSDNRSNSQDSNRNDRGNNQDGNRNDRGNSNRNDRNSSRDSNRNDRDNSRDSGRDSGRDNDRGPDRSDEDDFEGGSRRRGRRYRDRNRRSGGRDRFAGNEAEPAISEDDVLIPVAGILDVLDSYAFIRTTGYLTGANDVYVSLQQVRKHGLRRGDAVTGAIRQPRETDRRDKYNNLVRLDKVNGLDPDEARKRPEFHKLTPLYPQDR